MGIFKKSKEELEEEQKEFKFGEMISKKCNFLEIKDTGSADIPYNACGLTLDIGFIKKCDGENCILIKILNKLERVEKIK